MKKNANTNFKKAVLLAGAFSVATGAYAIGSERLITNVSAAEVKDAKGVITLKGSSATGTGDGYEIKDGEVQINEGGTYVLKGTGENIQVEVNADAQDVILVLNGVTITNTDNAPIYVKKANKTVIRLADGTTNTISDTKSDVELTDETEREANAAVYSKADLVLEGTGTLNVNGNYKNGIVSKDNLTINSGTYVVKAENNAFVGKDSLSIVNGTFDVNAGGDGFQSDNVSENAEEETGFVTIDNGKFTITSGNDAIQAETTLTINNGDFEITTNGGYEANTTVRTDQMPAGFDPSTMTLPEGFDPSTMTPPEGFDPSTMPTPPEGFDPANRGTRPALPPTMQFDENGKPIEDANTSATTSTGTKTTNTAPPEIPAAMQVDENGKPIENANTNTSVTTSTTETATDATATEETTVSDSYKGLKANNIIINNGTFNINSNDDAVHANNDLTINNGKFTVSTGDDAIHADNKVQINNETNIDVVQSYEAIEGLIVEINNGTINLKANDDGINASGEEESAPFTNQAFNIETDPYIIINDGYITIDSSADSIDSNGALFINGGDIYVNGPNSNVELAIDFDNGTANVDGGTVMAVGGSSNMMTSFSETSKQVSFTYFFTETQTADSKLQVLDSKGNVVVEMQPTKSYSSVIVSSDKLVKGGTYTIKNGSTSQTITLSSTTMTTSNGTAKTGGPSGTKPQRQTSNTTTTTDKTTVATV